MPGQGKPHLPAGIRWHDCHKEKLMGESYPWPYLAGISVKREDTGSIKMCLFLLLCGSSLGDEPGLNIPT